MWISKNSRRIVTATKGYFDSLPNSTQQNVSFISLAVSQALNFILFIHFCLVIYWCIMGIFTFTSLVYQLALSNQLRQIVGSIHRRHNPVTLKLPQSNFASSNSNGSNIIDRSNCFFSPVNIAVYSLSSKSRFSDINFSNRRTIFMVP